MADANRVGMRTRLTFGITAVYVVILACAFTPAANAASKALLLTQRFTAGYTPPSSTYATQLWALRGDTEGFQLVVNDPATTLHARFSGSTDPLISDNGRFLRVGFVHITAPSTGIGSTAGWYADPLPPQNTEGLDTTPNTWGGFAVLVDVPDTAAGGDYSGTVEVTNESDVVVATQAFSLHVASLAPLASDAPQQFKAMVGFNPAMYIHQVPTNDWVSQSTSVLNFLSKQHITPNEWPYSSTPGVLDTYMGMKWRSTPFPKPAVNYSWSSDAIGGLAPTISSNYQNWEDNGYADARNLMFAWDEPSTVAEHKQIPALAKVVHQNAPTVKVMITTTPKTPYRTRRLCTKFGKRRCVKFPGSTYSNANLWNGGADDVDIFTIAAHRFYGKFTSPLERSYRINHTLDTLKRVLNVRGYGKDTWSYSYYMPTKQVPQLVIDAPGTDPQMLMWWNASIGNKGWFLWQFARWAAPQRGSTVPRNPYTNPLSGLGASGTRDNGEASLAYPPLSAQYGLTNPNAEPVSSLRLETLRDGIEDATMINRYRARFGTTATNALMAQLYGKVQVVRGTGYTWPVYSNGTAGVKMQQLRRTMITALDS